MPFTFFLFFFFFFNDTATTEIYTLSLHDALPIDVFATSAGRSSTGRPAAISPPFTSRVESSPHPGTPSTCHSEREFREVGLTVRAVVRYNRRDRVERHRSCKSLARQSSFRRSDISGVEQRAMVDRRRLGPG